MKRLIFSCLGLFIRKLATAEYDNAANLSYQVYMECGNNDLTQAGIEAFKRFIYDISLMAELDIYGAFDNGRLIGIIGIHREKQHISLFFVQKQYHRQGIGNSLFNYMMEYYKFTRISVNSSTYAVPFYQSLGFKVVGDKERNKGIVSVPMVKG